MLDKCKELFPDYMREAIKKNGWKLSEEDICTDNRRVYRAAEEQYINEELNIITSELVFESWYERYLRNPLNKQLQDTYDRKKNDLNYYSVSMFDNTKTIKTISSLWRPKKVIISGEHDTDLGILTNPNISDGHMDMFKYEKPYQFKNNKFQIEKYEEDTNNE